VKRLEAIKAEGKISQAVYEQLKREYADKLEELESRIRELEEAMRKPREQR